MLQVLSLRKTFRSKGDEVEAVRGIDLEVGAGEVLGFLGPNGAGKTTTIKMIAGLIRRDGGSVRLAGRDPEADRHALADLGVVLEGNRNLYWRLTARENLEYFGVLRGLSRTVARQRTAELLARFDLASRRDDPVRILSRGMQQRLALAVAWLHRPRLLLLDEPTLGLDPGAAEVVKKLIQEIVEEGHAVLLTTHQMGVAEEIAQRIAIINYGQILTQGGTAELLRRFSGETWRVTLEEALDESRRQRVLELGGWLSNGHVEFMGSADGLYRLLDTLRPLPIAKVERDQSNLNGIFLKLVGGEADA
ncbi:MAG TPA: ABC transporter ATP-binding protein [Thermoanaerobaculia bacterium]|nr:ABC transporter ATP-binding protein [Thermoanaerobaculia bacterium]